MSATPKQAAEAVATAIRAVDPVFYAILKNKKVGSSDRDDRATAYLRAWREVDRAILRAERIADIVAWKAYMVAEQAAKDASKASSDVLHRRLRENDGKPVTDWIWHHDATINAALEKASDAERAKEAARAVLVTRLTDIGVPPRSFHELVTMAVARWGKPAERWRTVTTRQRRAMWEFDGGFVELFERPSCVILRAISRADDYDESEWTVSDTVEPGRDAPALPMADTMEAAELFLRPRKRKRRRA